jgi:transposase InsO family protein
MPWTNTPTTEQRQKFFTLANSGRFTVTELCGEFGISRKCGHKWLVRHAQGGAAALADGSRAPHSVPLRTSEAIERIVISERRLHPTWGPKKIRAVLERKHSLEAPPAISTLGEILKRNGLIEARRRRPGAFEVKRGDLTEALRPNHFWATDFKGWFYTKDQERCDPLTVTDLFSRYLLSVQALPQATQRWTRMAYTNLFRTHGLPVRSKTAAMSACTARSKPSAASLPAQTVWRSRSALTGGAKSSMRSDHMRPSGSVCRMTCITKVRSGSMTASPWICMVHGCKHIP